MKNRRIARIAVCLSLLLGLSACGKPETEPQETTVVTTGAEVPSGTGSRENTAEQPTAPATDAKSPEDDGYSGLIPLAPREE